MKVKDKGRNNHIIGLSGNYPNVTVVFRGDNNILEFNKGDKSFSKKRPTEIIVTGDNNFMTLGLGCQLGGEYHLANNSRITICNGTKIVGGRLFAMEGSQIHIGENCLISQNVTIKTSDHHSIVDVAGKRINHAGDVFIHSNVWLCENVTILKGVDIAEGCVVGHSSLVVKNLDKPNCVYAANPVALIRENIKWYKDLL